MPLTTSSPPFAATGSYPVRVASELDFYIDGEEAFAAIAQAIESAQSYVYMTCAYSSLNFRMRPPASEQLADLCSRLAQRGVRVAMLFWQPVDVRGNPDLKMAGTVPHSAYSDLAAQAPKVMARWDIAKTAGIYPAMLGCHHQKTFIIDGKIAFVGGINMTQDYWDSSAHAIDDERRVSYDVTDPSQRTAKAKDALPLHDVFARLTGPAVGDVEANFVERWNGASFRHGDDLVAAMPTDPSPAGSTVQIVRTIAPHTYPHTAAGETSIKETMINVLRGATRSVYFENQYFFDDDIVAALRAAGERGVRIVGLLARRPDAGQFVGVIEHLLEGHWQSAFQWTHLNPMLRQQIQLYCPVTSDGVKCKDIYVHSKTMIVDDRYVIVGSANISFTSLDFHSEMCVLAEDAARALALRKRLWAEHLCCAPGEIPDDFESGANVWRDHGERNQAARGKSALASRVLPLHAPRLGDDVPGILDGGASDGSMF
jgi:phosphatidylserine/phosphatidylglycerophosphate/cardiolipin synthase-like enzyme